MKNWLYVSAFLLVVTQLKAADEAWVRQYVYGEGGVVVAMSDTPYTGTGGGYTPNLAVGDYGSMFELWARGTAFDTNLYLLDSKVVGTYGPAASITIVTADPTYYRHDPSTGRYTVRTRADYAFSVSVNISGLVTSASASKGEKAVFFSAAAKNYNTTALNDYTSTGQTEIKLTQYDSEFGNTNGQQVVANNIFHALGNPSGIYASGEQTFKITSFATDVVAARDVTTPLLEIWPKTKVTQDRLVEGKVEYDKIAPFNIEVRSMYPSSYTYIQIYQGQAPADGSAKPKDSSVQVIAGTERKYGRYDTPTGAYNSSLTETTSRPHDEVITIEDLSNYTKKDGIYTVEVVTNTQLSGSPERIAKWTFEVDRIISSRGQLSTK